MSAFHTLALTRLRRPMLTMLALLALQMQVHYALDLPKLRRGRKRKSADPDDGASTTPRFPNDWTHEEDVKLLEVIPHASSP